MKHLNRTRVKICGITNLEDANLAVAAGADAIGLVFFANSPRYIAIDVAREITNNIPPFINCVGLFVDAEETYIRQVLEQVAIDTLQFHGQESERACALYNRPYIKAVRMNKNIRLADELRKYPSAQAVLLDSYVQDVPGGTGRTFDWRMIPADLSKPIILAGGLHDDNVKSAISEVRPYAVDASSGVEREKGIKNPSKIKNFMDAVMNV